MGQEPRLAVSCLCQHSAKTTGIHRHAQFLQTWEVSCILLVMVDNIDCHLDGAYSHHGNKLPGMFDSLQIGESML